MKIDITITGSATVADGDEMMSNLDDIREAMITLRGFGEFEGKLIVSGDRTEITL